MAGRRPSDPVSLHIASLTCSCTMQFKDEVLKFAEKRKTSLSLLIRELIIEEMKKDKEYEKIAS